MAKGRRVPGWLARRTYFKRIERWAKPDKTRKAMAAPEIAPAPLPSNVVPFPLRPARVDHPDFSDLRGVGIA